MNRIETKSKIEALFKTGDTYYYSDIVRITNIPLDLVVEICDELLKEKKIFYDISLVEMI